MNSNYAPVNTNVQNFVNIETEIETNINVNGGGGGGGGHGGHHFAPNRPHHDHDHEDDHEDDHDDEATDEWGWPVWNGDEETHDHDNAEEENPEWGFPVWDGGEWEDHDWESDPTFDELLQMVRGKLGLNSPSDMMARLDKEEVKTLLVNFFIRLNKTMNLITNMVIIMRTMSQTITNQMITPINLELIKHHVLTHQAPLVYQQLMHQLQLQLKQPKRQPKRQLIMNLVKPPRHQSTTNLDQNQNHHLLIMSHK